MASTPPTDRAGAPVRLHVCFLWHMHQPSYRDPVTGEVLMPWTRLHGAKDYTDMALALDAVPDATCTVNWVPGLLDQLDDVAAGELDRFAKLTLVPADELHADEIQFVRKHFFAVDHKRLLEPWPRFRELRDAVASGRALTVDEVRDLQVWFNLAWCGAATREEPEVARLLTQGARFTEADKRVVLEAQQRAAGRVVDRYRALVEAGRVELSCTPYYHPILPLLVDTQYARVADPHTPMPSTRFQWPSDGQRHLARAVARHAERFGRAPAGTWPSEGSVAPPIIPQMEAAGLRWFCTDEGILEKSLGRQLTAADKFRPWRVGGTLGFFRDRGLSDRIGFDYAAWEPTHAYEEFAGHVARIRDGLGDAGPGVLTVALDGENCWETYPGGVTAFLPGFLDRLASLPGVRLSSFEEACAHVRPAGELDPVGTGSWIGGTFRTWSGDPSKNRGWELLTAARDAVGRPIDRLWDEDPVLADLVMRAEASDWFWWLGEGNSTEFDGHFDHLFRQHLIAIYRHIGQAPPADLYQPIDPSRPAADYPEARTAA